MPDIVGGTKDQHKIGLVLSGGGARGVAHLGMIQALEEQGLKFDIVAGASAGALVGALYCYGHTPKEISRFISETNFLTIFRPSFNRRSLLNIEKAYDELRKHLPIDDFSSLKIPLHVSTTDIERGEPHIFEKGPLIKPVLASCAIPVVFDAVTIGSRRLVDGGVTDNLPFQSIRKSSRKIIALHCNPIDDNSKMSNWSDLMERSMMIAITRYVHSQKQYCDVFLEPTGLSKFKVIDFKKADEIYVYGYNYACEAIQNGILNNLDSNEKEVL
ncbi:MAG: patatin-like phospholipase family protein [Cyclobacteriaceae bacterium]